MKRWLCTLKSFLRARLTSGLFFFLLKMKGRSLSVHIQLQFLSVPPPFSSVISRPVAPLESSCGCRKNTWLASEITPLGWPLLINPNHASIIEFFWKIERQLTRRDILKALKEEGRGWRSRSRRRKRRRVLNKQQPGRPHEERNLFSPSTSRSRWNNSKRCLSLLDVMFASPVERLLKKGMILESLQSQIYATL